MRKGVNVKRCNRVNGFRLNGLHFFESIFPNEIDWRHLVSRPFAIYKIIE